MNTFALSPEQCSLQVAARSIESAMAKTVKKKANRTATGRLNKSAWIRSQPAALSAKEVVDKAKQDGIVLSLAQVYTARSTAKHRPGQSGRGTAPVAKRGPGRPKAAESKAASGDLRRQFMALTVRLGTDEARRLLDRVERVQSGS